MPHPPRHFGCALALHSAQPRERRAGCAWTSVLPCAARAPASGPMRSRLDTAEVAVITMTWTVRLQVRSAGFHPAQMGSIPIRSATHNRSHRRACASVTEIGRNDWAAPEPVTGTFCFHLLSSMEQSAGLRSRRCTFESCRRYQCVSAWQSGRLRLIANQVSSQSRWFESTRTLQDKARAFGCGRSSTAELRVVVPPVSVRFRPVTPKRMVFLHALVAKPSIQGAHHETEVRAARRRLLSPHRCASAVAATRLRHRSSAVNAWCTAAST